MQIKLKVHPLLKDQIGILDAILHHDDLCYPVPVPSFATTSPDDLAKLASTILNTPTHGYENLEMGLGAAFNDMRSGDIVSLCGSLYLVGEFLKKYT